MIILKKRSLVVLSSEFLLEIPRYVLSCLCSSISMPKIVASLYRKPTSENRKPSHGHTDLNMGI